MTGADGRKIFLSYGHAQEREVEEVAAKLRASGHGVFFDKTSLRSEKYDQKIREEVLLCDLFVFFASESSLSQGAYALTELGYAEERWADPSGRVLAFNFDDVEVERAPAYVRANLTLQRVTGNFATGVYNLVVAHLDDTELPSEAKSVPPDQLSLAECAQRITDALSKRRKLPHSGPEATEIEVELDALVASVRARFRPDEGSTVAGARLVKVIGVGNFGTVWEAVNADGRRVAVKIFRLERLREGQMLFRFRKSIRAMRLLSEEKRLAKNAEAEGAIVSFLHSDPTGLAFSMRLLGGGNLDGIDRFGWTLAHKLEVLSRVCLAVAYSHANGVIHRDIKPANIVLDDKGLPVLTDFDIADIKFATSMSTTVEGGLGTPVFAAPEQLEDAELANERSDVYSLGRLLHFMLIERSPGYQVEKDPTLGSLSSFSPAIVEVVRKATQHDPKRRFASVNAMLTAVEQCQTGAAAWRARAFRSRRWLRANWFVMAVVLLVVSASLGAAWYQKKVAARFDDLNARLLASMGARHEASARLEAAEERIKAINEQSKTSPTANLRIELEDAEKEREAAKAALAELDKRDAELKAQMEAARKALLTLGFTATAVSSPAAAVKVAPSGAAHAVARPPRECAQLCTSSGKCTLQQGTCVALQDRDCEKADSCRSSGACTAQDGKCVATAEGDCRASVSCKYLGLCVAKNGSCVAGSDGNCRDSQNCKTAGACTDRNGTCIADYDLDCEHSSNCKNAGLCTLTANARCAVGSDLNCKQSLLCKVEGACSRQGNECGAASSSDCAASSDCEKSGLCTLQRRNGIGVCVAGSDDDCKRSQVCPSDRACFMRGNRCVDAHGELPGSRDRGG